MGLLVIFELVCIIKAVTVLNSLNPQCVLTVCSSHTWKMYIIPHDEKNTFLKFDQVLAFKPHLVGGY